MKLQENVSISGKPISQVVKELDLTESALRKWVKQAQIDEEASPDCPFF
jgi:transposase